MVLDDESASRSSTRGRSSTATPSSCLATTTRRSADLPAELIEPFFERAQRLSVAVRDAMGAQGSFVAMNNVVSQSVPHLHCHVVPRVKKDGLRGFFWPRTKYESDDEAAAVAERVRAELASEVSG